MGLEQFLASHNTELAELYHRVQGRGGHSKQVYARRRCAFLAILTFLTGFIAGRTGGSQRQQQRRLERVRRRRETLEQPNAKPERGELLVEWSSEEEERSRSPPRPSSSAYPSARGFERGYSSGSVEVSALTAEEEYPRSAQPPPKPPTARPKGPSGDRTPTPPPSGRIATSSVPSSAPSVPLGRRPPAPIERPSEPIHPPIERPSEPIYPPIERPARPTLRQLDYPSRYSADITTLAEGIAQDLTVDTGAGVIISLDQHGVCDAVPIAQVHEIFSLVGASPRASVVICSYASLYSPHRQSTRAFAEGLVNFTRVSASLVHTTGKDRPPGDKASFLESLLRELDSLLDFPLSVVHFDDSWRVTNAIAARGVPTLRAITWDGNKPQRYSLLEHVRWQIEQAAASSS